MKYFHLLTEQNGKRTSPLMEPKRKIRQRNQNQIFINREFLPSAIGGPLGAEKSAALRPDGDKLRMILLLSHNIVSNYDQSEIPSPSSSSSSTRSASPPTKVYLLKCVCLPESEYDRNRMVGIKITIRNH